ncbi:hypothetical protein [Microbacterium sp. SS28]|uniref:hypothetical protein n=1 Tax=Microbacterium sp. SS28 TaxID=2919948 RepID=UPI001FAB0EE9|nr:hypothetical protein [Microbacterium sp. SS28]
MTAATLAPTATAERRILELLDRVGEVRPAPAERARVELDVSLARMRGSAVGGLAWESSCLTPTRYPVEFAVTSATDELRTVVDVLAPEDDRRTALDEADRIAQRFGSAGLAPETADALRRHQHGMRLRFGAWLGSRHAAAATTHKLYVEVDPDPERARRLLDTLAPEAWRVLGGAGPVRFVGIGLAGTRAVELYARPPYVDGDLLRVLAARGGMPQLAEPLAHAALGPGEAGSGRNIPVSVATADGRITAIAAFAFAHQRLRRDHRVRASVLARAEAQHWASAEVYAAASLPLADPAPMRRPFHTALSEIAVHGGHEIIHHVGMAPPPARPRRRDGSPAPIAREQGEGR